MCDKKTSENKTHLTFIFIFIRVCYCKKESNKNETDIKWNAICLNHKEREPTLVVSDLRSETQGSRFESGC